MLEVTLSNQKLALEDQFLSLEISLHDGLMLLAEMDELLEKPGQESYTLLGSYYQRQLSSLLQLPARERQSLLQDVSLEALACLLKMLKGTSTEVLLKQNLSQRRLRQLEEEPVYQQSRPPEIATLKSALSGFFQHLDDKVSQGEILLPDPDEPHY
ncbi:FliG C-terminal domain-containing protein [Marinospirillum sp.]|uniref:FliG C-terminal domain-containing protein n=1 Tax=Marinospirillum sp. TaxID=2183934 RepID=UPI00384DF140